MPHDEWAECPNCGKTAWGRNEIEAEFAIQKLTSLIEPIMIVLLAFIVGFVVISIAMPMFQVMGAV